MLARDIQYRAMGLGDVLMVAALQVAVQAADIIGIAGIFLVAIDDRAYTLYTEFGFYDFDGDQFIGWNRMFLPMSEARLIVAALSKGDL